MDLGFETGIISDFEISYPTLNINAAYEFRPANAFFSLLANPGILIMENNSIDGAFPISMNFIIGNKIRICPNVGGFYWTNRRWGWSAGLSIQIECKEKIILFVKSNYLRVYHKDFYPYHFGGGAYYTSNDPGINLSIGLKYRFKLGST